MKRDFGEWLDARRVALGLAQWELAQRARLPERTVRRVLSGQSEDLRVRVFFQLVTAVGEDPAAVYEQVTLSGDSSKARESTYAALAMLRTSVDLARASAG